MKPKDICVWLFMSIFLLSNQGFSKDTAGGAKKNPIAWEEVYCIGGDALDSVDLMVELNPKEDIAHLTVITGSSSDEKKGLKRNFTVHLKKDSFKKMVRDGKIELVLNSDKYPETAFGGEIKFAALLELGREGKKDFSGHMALDGSVFEIRCPKDPEHYFASRGFKVTFLR